MYKYFIVVLFSILGFSQENQVQVAEDFQKDLNESYKDSLHSPLMKEDLIHFETLDFYPISEKFIVEATFIRTKKEKAFKMKTSTERTPMYKKYGELHFEIDGKPFKLNIYQNIELSSKPGFDDYLFLPFSDQTNGNETYIGGRYLDMRMPKTKTVIINFNKAYNPYCAYNYKYSCPIVPLENDLDIKIEAGVKKFHE